MFERLKLAVNVLRGKSLDLGPGWITTGGSRGFRDAGEIWRDKINDTTAQLERIPARAAVVFSCVAKTVQLCSEAPVRTGREIENGWEDLPDQPLAALLRRPNAYMSYEELQDCYIGNLLLTGESFIWKWRDAGGYVSELWPVPTSWVSPQFDKAGALTHYQIYQGGNAAPRNVLEEDLLRIWYPDRSAPLLALGPLQAALRDVRVDEQRQDYQMELLCNNRRPGMVVQTREDLSEPQKEEIRAYFRRGLSDGNRGLPAFLFGEGSAMNPFPQIQELDWPGLSALSETRICSAFGIPPVLIGLRSGNDMATYSNYGQAVTACYEGTIAPLLRRLDAALTRGLVGAEELSGFEIYHDTSCVRGLKEDANARAERAAKMWSAGLVTKNEAREMCELDSIGSAGDVYLRAMTSEEVPAGAPTDETPPTDDGSGTGFQPVNESAATGKMPVPQEPDAGKMPVPQEPDAGGLPAPQEGAQ